MSNGLYDYVSSEEDKQGLVVEARLLFSVLVTAKNMITKRRGNRSNISSSIALGWPIAGCGSCVCGEDLCRVTFLLLHALSFPSCFLNIFQGDYIGDYYGGHSGKY